MTIMEYRICTRCVMDTTDPDIEFDSQGVCNHCRKAVSVLSQAPFTCSDQEKEKQLANLVNKIKKAGRGLSYDCIIGLSGGVDSSYVALKVKEMGLRPLAVHLDNGWDSELAVQNIENICKKLDIDLYTWVLNWEEFKDLQLAFLKASTPDSEVPSDNAIFGAIWRIAAKYQLKYIIAGNNVASESILPDAWSQGHFDAKYIRTLQKRFGRGGLGKFPVISMYEVFFNKKLKGVQMISLLNYFPNYSREEAKELIIRELGWRDYGRKHCESNYTKIFQEYILPQKFGFDKRKAHYSSLIAAGQMSREEALEMLKTPLYASSEELEEDIKYLVNKFGISREEFQAIMDAEPKSYHDYPNSKDNWYFPILRKYYDRWIVKA